MILDFVVKGQELSRNGSELIVSDTINYLTAHFRFSGAWAGLEKHALFEKDSDTYDVTLTDDSILETDHLNLTDGTWLLSVVGIEIVDAVITQRITTQQIELSVKESGNTSGEPFPPSWGSYVCVKLNQATPQTIIDGVPLLASDRIIDSDNQLADKKYVDDKVATVTADDFDHNDLDGLQGGGATERYHMTAAENAALHAHSNKEALDATSGTNTGDQNAAGVANTPAGNISATTVQAAINELDTGKEAVANKVTSLSGASTDTQYPSAKSVYDRLVLQESKRYGVRFDGSVSAGTRLYGAAGLSVNVGVGTTAVVNDFDSILPWSGMRRCNTTLHNGERVPTYFEGEAGYSNTAADVYVYVPLFYYFRSADDSEHVVSMSPLAGYRPPKKFRRADNSLRDFCFLPAYTAGVDANGVPVSRSGYYPHITSLNGWMALAAQKHTAETLDSDIWIEGTKDDEIKNILLDIEFATRDHQTVMRGACSMRYAADVTTAGGTNQFTLPAATAAYYKVGQAIAIGTTGNAQDVANNATITAVDTTTGVITFTPAGADVTVATGNYIKSRPWKSGACDNVKASSGSPESNTSGVYPCKYRGIENPWGNQYRGRWDYLQNNHAPSILLDPAKYAAGAISADYHALSYTVPTANGYATEMGFDPDYPFARITKAVGGSSTTYFADYFYQATGVRALLVGGSVSNGRDAGSRCFYVSASPSDAYWPFGAALSPA